MESAFHNYSLVLRTLTPLHVGGAMEKHRQKDIDFRYHKGKVFQLDFDRILKHNRLDPFLVADYLSGDRSGGLGVLLRNEKIPWETLFIGEGIPADADPGSEIKAFVKSGLDGSAFLPGSSFKGALRSIIYGKLKRDNKAKRPENLQKSQSDEASFLGDFDNSLFRFIRVSNSSPGLPLQLYRTKTFNLHGGGRSWAGGWRHGINQTTTDFREEGSVFTYECLPPDTDVPLSMQWLKTAGAYFEQLIAWNNKQEINGKGKNLPRSFPQFFRADFDLTALLALINEHTVAHLKKEIAFFQKYCQRLREGNHIIDTYQRLLDTAQKANGRYALMRLAHGVGFHTMTGDWQYDNYCDDNDLNWKTNKKKYKSRKLIFQTGRNGYPDFFPMGFVMVMPEPYYDAHFRQQALEKQAKLETERLAEQARLEAERKATELAFEAEQAAAKAAQEEAERQALAAKLPQMTSADPKKLKKGLEIDGVVTGTIHPFILIKPYLSGYEHLELKVRYPAGMPTGTAVRITVLLQGNQLTISGSPKIK